MSPVAAGIAAAVGSALGAGYVTSKTVRREVRTYFTILIAKSAVHMATGENINVVARPFQFDDHGHIVLPK